MTYQEITNGTKGIAVDQEALQGTDGGEVHRKGGWERAEKMDEEQTTFLNFLCQELLGRKWRILWIRYVIASFICQEAATVQKLFLFFWPKFPKVPHPEISMLSEGENCVCWVFCWWTFCSQIPAEWRQEAWRKRETEKLTKLALMTLLVNKFSFYVSKSHALKSSLKFWHMPHCSCS